MYLLHLKLQCIICILRFFVPLSACCYSSFTLEMSLTSRGKTYEPSTVVAHSLVQIQDISATRQQQPTNCYSLAVSSFDPIFFEAMVSPLQHYYFIIAFLPFNFSEEQEEKKSELGLLAELQCYLMKHAKKIH